MFHVNLAEDSHEISSLIFPEKKILNSLTTRDENS